MCFYKLDPNTFEGPFKRSTCLRYLIQWNPLKLEYIIYEIFLLMVLTALPINQNVVVKYLPSPHRKICSRLNRVNL